MKGRRICAIVFALTGWVGMMSSATWAQGGLDTEAANVSADDALVSEENESAHPADLPEGGALEVIDTGERDVQWLREAAVALQAVNDDLAARLTTLAEKEETLWEQANSGEKEDDGLSEEQWLEEQRKDIKLLRDSAAALKGSDPLLSGHITELAGRKEESLKMEEEEGGDEDDPGKEEGLKK